MGWLSIWHVMMMMSIPHWMSSESNANTVTYLIRTHSSYINNKQSHNRIKMTVNRTSLLTFGAILALMVCVIDCAGPDPIVRASLEQVCSNPHGGHLNKELITANYDELAAVFEGIPELKQLFVERKARLKNSLKNGESPTKTLNDHTSALCGALELLDNFVMDKEFD
jgi:hypothetical protein